MLYATMTPSELVRRIVAQEDLNFLLTNRIPRHLATRFMGWFSRIEQPLLRDLSIGAWRLFTDLDLSDARRTDFRSLHECFTRELVDGARPFRPGPGMLASPSDAIVGACGRVEDARAFQAKGFPYRLAELFGDERLANEYRDGCYATLRLTSAMYHRFHAPHDLRVERVTYISGDTWNVNPVALARVERLFCRNERALVRTRLARGGAVVTLVPVAAILVASIRLRFVDVRLHLAPSRAERDRLRRAARQGRGDGLVRARLHDHRLRARGLHARRRHRAGREDPCGPGADEAAASHRIVTEAR